MDYTECQSMEGDCLQTTRFLCSSIYKTKLGKCILILLLAIHGTFTIGYIYFSFNVDKDFKKFVSQAPMTLGALWALLEITVILCKPDLIEKLPQELRLWSTDSAGEKIDQKIKKEAKIVKLFTIANLSAGFFTSLLFIKTSPIDTKFFFAFYFFEKYFPEHSHLFGFLLRCTFSLLAYIAMTHALRLHFIYYTQHLKYQAIMFLKHTECLAKYSTSEQNNSKLYYDKEYQKEMSRRLDFIIKRHNEFKDLWALKKEEMGHLIGIFSLGGCLLGISFALWIIMFYEEIVQDRLTVVRGIFLSICTVVTFCSIFLFGQSLENVSLNRTKLTSEWYLFNNSNKKKFLIFMINTSKPIKIQFLNNSVNFQLGLKVVKGIYAIASVLFKMKMHY